MLEIQKLYNQANTKEEFLDILASLGVNVKDYFDHKMWLLDYDQIECVKNHPVVNESRGLLMAYDGTIVRKGFTRFYNLGENGVDTFDFENSITFEKADGSLMFVYFCPQTNRWEIGTRGTAFAEGPNEWFGTFRGFMLDAMGRTEDEFQEDCRMMFSREYTYLFEAVGPDNRIVTPYETNHLVELGMIYNFTGEDFPCLDDDNMSFAHPWNVRPIKVYDFKTQESCLTAISELSGLQEGFVVFNTKTKERVKIKSPVYLAAHRLRGNGLTVNAICELVALNEVDEYLAVFPEDAPKFEDAKAMFAYMHNELTDNYFKHKDIETQKDFALAVKDLSLSCVLFKARKSNVQDVMGLMHEFNSFPASRRAEWLKERLV